MQRLETLTRDVIRLAKVTDTNVDVPLAQICFDKVRRSGREGGSEF